MRLLVLVTLLAVGGCAPGKPPELVCTMEAKACPGGSYVGRDPGRNCEFRACPK